MIDFRTTGDWQPGQVTVSWVPSSFVERPEVTRLVEETWQKESARPGVHLFDGPMCRLESFAASAQRLRLMLSLTTYKAFLGTNMHNSWIADAHGLSALANPVGLSCALASADGFLLMGRRNERVAYYPGRVHPFAGALEPGRDVFAEVYRELGEELGLGQGDVESIRCVAIVEDRRLRQPEMMFLAKGTRGRAEIEARLDAREHHAVAAFPLTREGLEEALRQAEQFTPVGVAGVLLTGIDVLGKEWFGEARKRVGA